MYLPEHFSEARSDVIREIVEHFPLASLCAVTEAGLVANHLPFLVDQDAEQWTLLAHVANSNPLLKEVREGAEVMVIFRAEDSYISPNWYPSKLLTHRHVPTWNYQAVHFYGRIEFIRERKFLIGVVGRLTKIHERTAAEPRPWKMSEAPQEYLDTMLASITGVRIRVSRMIAKSKLSQNREAEDYRSVRDALEGRGKAFMSTQMKKP